jgi:hypothetical protein
MAHDRKSRLDSNDMVRGEMVKQKYLVSAITMGLAYIGIRTLWLNRPFLETAAIFALIAVLV